MMKNAKMEKLKCDILGDFQTLWPCCNSVTKQVNFNLTKINGKCQNWKTFMRYFRWFSSTVPSCNRRLFEKAFFFSYPKFFGNLINGNFMAHFTASWKIGHFLRCSCWLSNYWFCFSLITRCHAIITSIIGLNFLTSKLTWK